MNAEDRYARLVETFRLLGVDDPESWARSEIEEGIPQLAAIVFLKHLTRFTVQANDRSWLRSSAAKSVTEQIRRLREAGCSVDDLTAVVRAMQLDLVHELCYALDDVASERFDDEELERRTQHVRWGLFCLDECSRPTDHMDDLHEIVDCVIR